MSRFRTSMRDRIVGSFCWPIRFWKKPSDSATTVIEQSNLPTSLKQSIQQFVEQSEWGQKSTTSLARSMLRYFADQLESGVSVQTLAAQWNGATPSIEFRRLNEPNLLVIYTLPKPLTELIGKVIRRTRLWQREKVDVARELVVHFQDGMAAGRTPEELIEDFGNAETAARLIRRAKLRSRPLVWQMIRRTWQLIGVLLVVLASWWIFLLIRFQFSKPNIVRDYLGEVDARSTQLPESDRAWPLYRMALMKMKGNSGDHSYSLTPPLTEEGLLTPEWKGLVQVFDVQRVDGRELQRFYVSSDDSDAPPSTPNVQREYQFKIDEFYKALEELSLGPYWPAMVQYAQMNEEAIRLILQGAAKSNLGFIYRDSANAPWLISRNGELGYESFQKSTNSQLLGVLLPHIQSIMWFEYLLRIEIERARINGDPDRVVKILRDELQICAQLFHADGFTVTKLCGLRFSRGFCTAVGRILDEHREFLTDENLILLTHELAEFRRNTDLEFASDLKPFAEDILQRIYTDDGHQDGHLTAEGWRLLLVDSMRNNNLPGQFQLEGSLMSGVVASRAELKQVLDRSYELDQQESRPPLWEIDWQAPVPSVEYLKGILSTKVGHIKYRPLVFFEPILKFSPANPNQYPHVVGELAKMQCDGTLIALRLSLYHSRHGEWPTNLDQLIPEQLSIVPLDRFDGNPMKYRLIDGNPVVYSVGRNRIDDGGSWDSEATPGYECLDGDWRLWPIRKGDK